MANQRGQRTRSMGGWGVQPMATVQTITWGGWRFLAADATGKQRGRIRLRTSFPAVAAKHALELAQHTLGSARRQAACLTAVEPPRTSVGGVVAASRRTVCPRRPCVAAVRQGSYRERVWERWWMMVNGLSRLVSQRRGPRYEAVSAAWGTGAMDSNFGDSNLGGVRWRLLHLLNKS